MRFSVFARRFLFPAPFVSLWYFFKFGCRINFRSEVEFSPNLKIGRKTNIGAFAKIKADQGPLVIGERVDIAAGCQILPGEAGVTIGDDCLIGSHAVIIGVNYAYDRLDVPIRMQKGQSKGVVIGNNVWIGAGACILDGATIGNGAIITPNSVVSGNVSDNAIVQGNPSKVIFVRR